VTDDLSVWSPALATLGVFLCLAWLVPRDETRPAAHLGRMLAASLTGGLTLRYVSWRVGALPQAQSWPQDLWVMVFLVAEMLNHLSNLMALFFLSRTCNRSAEADAAADSPLIHAPTDVFIATFNEPIEVLERTLVGATDIDHPDLRVWVLDDGARDWVRELAERIGALYVCRVKGKHAKAGNVNNGLRHALMTGRRPEFVLLLDADFIANRQILRRTLGLFETHDVGIVQTPQHFFNPDPVQANLTCMHVWPDEQRFFFNVLLPSKDAWGAAFCCGTSAVFRVAALEAIGGLATETVTEDMLTSFKMREYGWRTIFLNERLSLGLAPEGLSEYIMQRGRWCLGGIQQLHTRWSPFGRGRIGLINRLSCFDSALYWTASFPFKLMMLAGPAIFWLTGTSVVAASTDELLYWLAPSVIATILFMTIYGRNLIIPVMTDITQLLSAVVVMINVFNGFFRPHGRPFKVTDKGVSRDKVTVHWRFMWPFLMIAIATIIGFALNVSPASPLLGQNGYAANTIWSVFNVAVLGLVCLACVDVPRRRKEERFASGERGVVIWPGGAGIECRLHDISLGGARLHAPRWHRVDDHGELALDYGRLRVPFRLLRQTEHDVVICFDPNVDTRRSLIARLFGGDYTRELEKVMVHRVLAALARHLLN
jgi:cellulose synthase (UDP-forming)